MIKKWLITYDRKDGRTEDFVCDSYNDLLENIEYFEGREGEIILIIEISIGSKEIAANDVTMDFFE